MFRIDRKNDGTYTESTKTRHKIAEHEEQLNGISEPTTAVLGSFGYDRNDELRDVNDEEDGNARNESVEFGDVILTRSGKEVDDTRIADLSVQRAVGESVYKVAELSVRRRRAAGGYVAAETQLQSRLEFLKAQLAQGAK